jgi:hypothetical protein
MCFLTCWFVVFLGEEIRWTRWGILSGLFWVPAAACGIYGIRNAGLAICVGTWSSCYVITSFIWGILIFEEKVQSIFHTGLAFTTLGIGLVGMSTYSKPPPVLVSNKKPKDEEAALLVNSDAIDGDADERTTTKRKTIDATSASPKRILQSLSSTVLEMEPIADDRFLKGNEVDKDRVVFFGGRLSFTKRQLGIIGAVVNGLWGGLNLIPLHFAQREGFGGAAYLISYAVGSMIVNTAMWLVYFLYYLHQRRYHFRDAVDALPDFHLDKLWMPGCLAGALYSIANFGSILAVTYLGQGVGFSLCQVQILVSGLWGIFYFKEIKGRETITKWVISACITVSGILWLTYQKAH